MNDEAANAFLKTLEEPPPGAVLILIGTSAELQLETIVSRCQVIRFDPLPEPVLAELLLEHGVAARSGRRRPAGCPGRGKREPGDRPGRPGAGAVSPRADRRAGRSTGSTPPSWPGGSAPSSSRRARSLSTRAAAPVC